jgi:phage-related protein
VDARSPFCIVLGILHPVDKAILISYNRFVQRGKDQMYNIIFYANKRGEQPVKEYIDSLKEKAETSKDSRIKLTKIIAYIDILSKNGTRAGENFIKHLEENIWELRPINDRILFFYWDQNKFVLLHHFKKKTQKTPRREIEQAKKNRDDFLERSGS